MRDLVNNTRDRIYIRPSIDVIDLTTIKELADAMGGNTYAGESWTKENSVFDEGSESSSMEGGVEDFHYTPWED